MLLSWDVSAQPMSSNRWYGVVLMALLKKIEIEEVKRRTK